MGWFSRKSDEAARAADATPDPELSFFTRPQADLFRATVRQVLAEDGYEVTVHGGHVETDDGRQWGLWNVAANAHNDENSGPAGWTDVIRRHFGSLFAADRTSTDDLSDDEYLGRLYLRLVEEAALASLGLDAHGHARSWADGILSLPVLDLPDIVVTPPEAELRTRGPMSALLDRAHRNTTSLVVTEPLTVERIEHEGRWFWCVLGDSVYTASMALVLPDLVARVQPGADTSRGIIFAVPYRHQVDFRVVEGAAAAIDALTLIPRFAMLGYDDSPGPLSPHTYLWLDGAVTRLTHLDDGGGLSVAVGPHLEAVLAAEDGPDRA